MTKGWVRPARRAGGIDPPHAGAHAPTPLTTWITTPLRQTGVCWQSPASCSSYRSWALHPLFHRWALIAGWAVGMGYGTLRLTTSSTRHRATLRRVTGGWFPGWHRWGHIALTAFAINGIVSVLVTFAGQQHFTLSYHHM